MMKKILLFGTLIALVTSCGEDNPVSTSTYPTDGLSLENKYNALLMMGSDNQNPASAVFEIARLQAVSEYPNRINTMHMLTTPTLHLYDFYGDSIMMNFQSPTSPFFVLDDQEILPNMLLDEAKSSLRKKPLLAVSHKVSQNDTAWIIDNKVKFFMDTLSNDVYIDTYMLAKLKAREYTIVSPAVLNLKMAATPKLISNPPAPVPNESQWDLDVISVDSSKTLAKKGSPFYYQNLFLAKYDSTSVWGSPLGSYWPFKGEYYNNDVIGTKETPIRHYFRKFTTDGSLPDDMISSMEITFMTIVWVKDKDTGSYVHANSYTSNSTFKIK